jgi:hypothetical protein
MLTLIFRRGLGLALPDAGRSGQRAADRQVVDAADAGAQAPDVGSVDMQLDQGRVGVISNPVGLLVLGPRRTAKAPQVTWSWMVVAWPGCQTSATTENDPAGSTQETSLVSRRVTKPLLRG